MEIREAKEALVSSLEDIMSIPAKYGFSVSRKCIYSNSDDEDSESYEGAECIFGQISVGLPEEEDSVVFSTAVCIFEQEDGSYTVSSEELASCVRDLRGEINDFLNSVVAISEEKGITTKEAFAERIAPALEVEEPRATGYNTKFYVVASIIALLVLAALVIWRNLG